MTLSNQTHGQWLSINLGWGFGIMFGCYMAMGISGAHMNPAVSLAMGKLYNVIFLMSAFNGMLRKLNHRD